MKQISTFQLRIVSRNLDLQLLLRFVSYNEDTVHFHLNIISYLCLRCLLMPKVHNTYIIVCLNDKTQISDKLFIYLIVIRFGRVAQYQ